MRRGGHGFHSHNIFEMLEDADNKATESDSDEEQSSNKNNEINTSRGSDPETQSYYCLEFSGLPLFVEMTQFLPIASKFGPVTHIDCDKSGFVYAFYDQKQVATKTLMSVNGKRFKSKIMTVQFSPNTVLPTVKKCYNCDQIGHFGIDCTAPQKPRPVTKKCNYCDKMGHSARYCVESASLPEEIIALIYTFTYTINFDVVPLQVSKKWRRAIQKHATYLYTHRRWSPVFDTFSNLDTLFIHEVPPRSLKNFPKLQTLVADIIFINSFPDAEFPSTLKYIKVKQVFQNGSVVECKLSSTWTQRTEFAGLESLSFDENIPGLPFTFKDVTHLTNLKRLNLPSLESPKAHLTSLTQLEHLGCAVVDDLTLFDAKIMARLTSFVPLRHCRTGGHEFVPQQIGSAAHKWLLEHVQLRAISVHAIESDFNFQIWPNLQSLSISDVSYMPALHQINTATLTELKFVGSTSTDLKLERFTNLVKLKIDTYTSKNSVFLEIVKLTKLKHLEFCTQAVFPAIDDTTIGLAKMPNLEYFALRTSARYAIEFLFLDEICELPALKSLNLDTDKDPNFMKIITRFKKVNCLRIYGSELTQQHAIEIRKQMKGPEYIYVQVGAVMQCMCDECC